MLRCGSRNRNLSRRDPRSSRTHESGSVLEIRRLRAGRLGMRERPRAGISVTVYFTFRFLGDGHELLAQSSLNIHLRPPQLPRTLEQLDKIIQVDYRSQGWIFPRGLVDLVRVDHVPVRIV